jgi:hypothetical protein
MGTGKIDEKVHQRYERGVLGGGRATSLEGRGASDRNRP